MIKVGIVGGTGYTGVELLRILARHPKVQLQTITSRGAEGATVAQMYPSLRGVVDLTFQAPDKAMLERCDVVFFATPHGVAMEMAPALLKAGVRIVDLSADFRLQDPEAYRRWYDHNHTCPELLTETVYGLPELHRNRLASANLVAAPGCYPTAVQLGFRPLIEAGIVDLNRLIADCKSGVSGAGRAAKVDMLMAEMGESFKAYGVPGHRHLPEIRQGLEAVAGQAVGLTFVPHLLPIIRGIHATLYATLKPGMEADIQQLYETAYAAEPFVDVLPAGSHPATSSVRGANTCRIAVHRPQNENVVVILSVIDNLVKGASGQAVQCMNLMFGLPEVMGLEMPALVP